VSPRVLPVGVADQQHGATDRLDGAAHVVGVRGHAAELVRGGDGADALGLQTRDDATAAGGLGEGSVHEDDGDVSHEVRSLRLFGSSVVELVMAFS
jgi:hypothetical protein